MASPTLREAAAENLPENHEHTFLLIVKSTRRTPPYELCTVCGEHRDVQSSSDDLRKEINGK
jgi:hypothetical protein